METQRLLSPGIPGLGNQLRAQGAPLGAPLILSPRMSVPTTAASILNGSAPPGYVLVSFFRCVRIVSTKKVCLQVPVVAGRSARFDLRALRRLHELHRPDGQSSVDGVRHCRSFGWVVRSLTRFPHFYALSLLLFPTGRPCFLYQFRPP